MSSDPSDTKSMEQTWRIICNWFRIMTRANSARSVSPPFDAVAAKISFPRIPEIWTKHCSARCELPGEKYACIWSLSVAS
ncbi:hypothetical protein IWW55_001921 [Coemansia sp. RSA 2706]|nr:hypothetical protein IWW55_001921 [Coemansia sp. RSA 2706]